MVPIELACNPGLCPEYPAGDVPRVLTAPAAVTARIPGYSIEIADGASEETILNTLLALLRRPYGHYPRHLPDGSLCGCTVPVLLTEKKYA